jgi:DNA polymerase III delta prime subunit
MEIFMNGLTPNCLDDFIYSNPSERDRLDLILSRKLPFPFTGKSGILFHGGWGTGKSTLSFLMPRLFETAYSGSWNLAQDVGQMPAPLVDDTMTEVFRCGGLSITAIINKVMACNSKSQVFHYSRHDYFVFDEIDKLTLGAQQSLKSVMDLERCMFFFNTNYLHKVDAGIINRCYLVEMNQGKDPNAYLKIASNVLTNMRLAATAVAESTVLAHASKAKGSLREFVSSVVIDGLKAGGIMPN